MQAVTHMAFGAALAVVLTPRRDEAQPRWRAGRIAAAVVAAALSHPLLDDLARATYHPPNAQLHDPFWLGFHALVAVATVAFAWRFRRHGWFMAASLLPDLDWVIGRPLGLWSEGSAHAAFRAIPGLSSVSEALRGVVPDLRGGRSGALLELGLVALLLAIVWRVGESRLDAERGADEGCVPEPIP